MDVESLPKPFCEKMKKLLGSEYEEFINTYNKDQQTALRVNTLKIEPSAFKKLAPFELQPVPWNEAGFYYDSLVRPGKHPFHAAGLYYIQEPSAMSVAPKLGVKPGDKVLDLAAAPGGKATQLATYLKGEGLLVANEIQPSRAKILAENLERFGVRNAVVTNETPDRLAKVFPEYFDAILLDAPCSGEGMFRKDLTACEEWTADTPAFCAKRQQEILLEAKKMLKPGGRLLYSTCTFAPEENEQIVAWLLEEDSALRLIPLASEHGLSPAEQKWSHSEVDVTGALRLWPHRVQGEGHFLALFEKVADSDFAEGCSGKNHKKRQKQKGSNTQRLDPDMTRLYEEFARDSLNIVPEGPFTLFGPHLYQMPLDPALLKGLKVLRPGLHLGTFGRKHFEPSHALALALGEQEFKQAVSLPAASAEIIKYLHGETWVADGPKGWTVIQVDGFPLGWAKQSDGYLKNHYPKGLRWL